MSRHRICGLVVDSELPLPEVPETDAAEARCRVRVTSGPAPAAPRAWLHEWRLPGGETWLSIGRSRSGYLLRFPELADFLVSADGGEVGCRSAAELPEATLRHLLLDQVLPLVVSLRGGLALHAAAVASGEEAIALLGATGQGKSTLGASLAREGLRLLTDDCLVIEESDGRLIAVPGYPGLRLWPPVIASLFGEEPGLASVAHYTEKKRLDARHGGLAFCEERLPIRRIFVLAPRDGSEDDTEIRVVPLAPRDAFMALLTHAYRLDITDRLRLSEEFDRLSRAARLPVHSRLDFPRNLERLPTVTKAIMRPLLEIR
jgi:hypothetical protein